MKQNKTVKLLVGIIVLLSVAFLAVSGIAIFLALRTPLAEPMALVKDNTPVPTVVSSANNDNQATATPEAAQAAKGTEVCGETGTMTLLFTGADFSDGVPPLGADSVRIIKVDFSNKRITSVAFPRDLLLKTAQLADLNMAEQRLGLAYHYKKQATNGADKHRITVATTLIGQTLYDNFGVEPANYFTLQLDNVDEMIDTLGGIDVNLPEAITTDRGIKFPAGQQTLNGKLSSQYVRTLGPGGEPARLQRQNIYVKGLQNKVISTNTIAKFPDLLKQFDKMIVTDLTPKQLTDLACMTKEVPQEQIIFHEIIGNDLVTARADGALIPNIDQIKAKLTEWLSK